MKTKSKLHILKIVFLSAALMACSFANSILPTASPVPPPTVTTTKIPTATPTITITPTPHYFVGTSSTIKVNSGGFSFSQIRGYKDVNESALGAYYTSADEKVEVGLIAFPRPSGAALSSLLSGWREVFGKDYDNVEIGAPEKKTIGEIDSVSTSFTGRDKNEPLQGRLAIYYQPGSKVLYLYVIAHGDQRWQREGETVFSVTEKSIRFIPITAMEGCPITKERNYGYLPETAIKIGGGNESGYRRIETYLAALLGPRDEIIRYDEFKPVTYKGAEIKVFYIQVGNDFKKLYFDTNHFEELHVVFGFKCSAPFPDKPFSWSSSS